MDAMNVDVKVADAALRGLEQREGACSRSLDFGRYAAYLELLHRHEAAVRVREHIVFSRFLPWQAFRSSPNGPTPR